jgi:hypothetical protein
MILRVDSAKLTKMENYKEWAGKCMTSFTKVSLKITFITDGADISVTLEFTGVHGIMDSDMDKENL